MFLIPLFNEAALCVFTVAPGCALGPGKICELFGHHTEFFGGNMMAWYVAPVLQQMWCYSVVEGGPLVRSASLMLASAVQS